MKDTFYFTLRYTENEHSFVEEIFEENLKSRGYELIYYRKYKNGHVPMWREAKTTAPRWVVLDICELYNIDIISSGFYYKKGTMTREVYEEGYEPC